MGVSIGVQFDDGGIENQGTERLITFMPAMRKLINRTLRFESDEWTCLQIKLVCSGRQNMLGPELPVRMAL